MKKGRMSRRRFLQLSAAAGAGLLLPWKLDLETVLASTQVEQTPLAGKDIPKYADPLPTFFGSRVTGANITIAMQEFQQQVLPISLYRDLQSPFNAGTWLWGYAANGARPAYPGNTVEAIRGTPTTIAYINNLPATPLLGRYLTIDQTIHWANPAGTVMTDMKQMTVPYVGPIPTVVHLHGGEVPSAFDGGPDGWFTVDGKHGAAYSSLTAVAANTAVYQYPNTQEATTLWFHDHTLGITRLNVFAGLAAFYLIRDDRDTGQPNNPLGLPAGRYETELLIQDRQFDTNGQLFFPDSDDGGLNGGPSYPGIHPFWIPEFFGDVNVVNGKAWPYLDVEPRRYRFRILNGANARMYQLRLVNQNTQGPGPAFWQIGSDGGLLDRPVTLNNPANPNDLRLLLAPGERADVIIDFADEQGQNLNLLNGANAPYPSGDLPDPETSGQIMQFRVNQTLAGPDQSYDPGSGKPLRANPIVVLDPARTGRALDKRRLLTIVESGDEDDGPLEGLLNNTKWTGKRERSEQAIPGFQPDAMGDLVSELPQVGSTEIWEILNLTEDAHPIHLHLVQFQLLDRQAFNVDAYREQYDSGFPGGTFQGLSYDAGAFIPGYGPSHDYFAPNAAGALGGNPDVTSFLHGPVTLPDRNETGWKDTIKAYPGEVTRIVVRFAPQHLAVADVKAGQNNYAFDPTQGPGYVWHCHILDHEDNEMMRPYRLVG